MQRSSRIEIALSLCAGILLGILATVLLSYTSAIAVPGWLLEHPLAEGNTNAVLRFWDALVVYSLAVGVPAFVICLVLFKVFIEPCWRVIIALLAGFLVYVHIVSPLMSGEQILVPDSSALAWYLALLANLVVGIGLSAILMRSRTAWAD